MLKVTYENKNNIQIVHFSGDLTSNNVKYIKKDLLLGKEALCNHIFDFTHLEIIDSTGLSYIINSLKKTIESHTQIKLLNLNNQPKMIFEITRVDSLFETYDNEEKIMNSFYNKETKNESFGY